ncbi:MAG: flagellar type III secretion system pore protein FliP [Alicyclobacillus sp.]|nr:flagellar type III secretion system pore protein FliP [Alicyclobacillus sp.]
MEKRKGRRPWRTPRRVVYKAGLCTLGLVVGTVVAGGCAHAWAAEPGNSLASVLPWLSDGSTGPQQVSSALKLILLLTVLSVAPGLLVLMTCFTRVVVVLSFVRNALSLQQSPPNQVLVGLALFITLFVMQPTLAAANQQALQPYLRGQISQAVAVQRAELPFKEFMAKHTRRQDLDLFLSYRHLPEPAQPAEIPLTALVPAYTISELKTAFQIGFMIYLPFLVIDLVVATTLMSMGMMMLPPVMISLPFKLLLFVLVDGWYLVVKSLLSGYA